MRFGTFFLLEKPAGLTDAQVYRNSLEQVQAAEQMGYDSVWLAEQVAMVDVMSGGRYLFGVGRGYQAGEYQGFNIPMDQSRGRFNEVLDICVGRWKNDRFSYGGKFYQVEDLALEPRPIQKPDPPVLITVIRTPESFKLAAARGYGVISGNPYRMDAEFREAFLLYRRTLEETGGLRMLDEFWALSQCFVHEDDRVASRRRAPPPNLTCAPS